MLVLNLLNTIKEFSRNTDKYHLIFVHVETIDELKKS